MEGWGPVEGGLDHALYDIIPFRFFAQKEAWSGWEWLTLSWRRLPLWWASMGLWMLDKCAGVFSHVTLATFKSWSPWQPSRIMPLCESLLCLTKEYEYTAGQEYNWPLMLFFCLLYKSLTLTTTLLQTLVPSSRTFTFSDFFPISSVDL